jgi:hypothetical protein
MVLNISNDEPVVVEKLTSNGSFANSTTPTAPKAVAWRQKKKSVEGDPYQEIYPAPLTGLASGKFLGL